MLSKLLALAHAKVAIAVVGVLLVGGTGTAVAAATGTVHLPTLPALTTATTATHGASADDAGAGAHASPTASDHAHTIAIEGALTAATSCPGSVTALTVTPRAAGSAPQTVMVVAGMTRVTGEHVATLADLCAAVGHDVQVQATRQNGTLVAWKITVQGAPAQGAANGTGDNPGGAGNPTASMATISGTVGTIGSTSVTSFTVVEASGAHVTITVSGQTRVEGAARAVTELKTGMRVTVQGTLQPDQSVAATRIEAQ